MTIEWTPRDDEWPSQRVGAAVHIYEPGEDLAPTVGHARPASGTWVDFGGALESPAEGAPPELRFTMPPVRPGSVHLSLSINPDLVMHAHPKILSCTGVARCAATVHNGPADVVMTVL
jgi:hypothetical protein